jgi:hypothetical protein
MSRCVEGLTRWWSVMSAVCDLDAIMAREALKDASSVRPLKSNGSTRTPALKITAH